MKRPILVLALILTAVPVLAQTTILPGAVTTLRWDAECTPGLTFAAYVDGVKAPTFGPVTPAGTSTDAEAPCSFVAPFPAVTPGPHSIELTCVLVAEGQTLESLKSSPLAVVMVALPKAPKSLRLGTGKP